ncbi:hypothetical protein E2542_SST06908 [Spatholobus suberectus]|nr:hypothetical protein E2542_SST06908 [Spatholobus suberectus]
MKTIVHTKSLIALFLFLNSVFIIMVEARPLSIIGTGRNSAAVGEMDFFDWLSLGALKNYGPIPGKGHVFTDSEALGGIKGGGPSSGGKGHQFSNSEILGGIKDSGPSNGQGH